MGLTGSPFHILHIFIACLVIVAFGEEGRGEARVDRFFLAGDGVVHIRNLRTGEEARVNLIRSDGSLCEEAFDRVDEIFGFPTREKEEHISPRLIFMLDHFSDLLAPGQVIEMESGYRSPEYNAGIRKAGANAARTSQHTDGMAIDFHIEGVDGKALWELIRSRECCGVGHYGGKTVHLDAAKPRFWEAATSKTRTRESDYNRKIYLSTDYDRYRAGDSMRLCFSSVSDFGFGIMPSVALVSDPEGTRTVVSLPARLRNPSTDSQCLPIVDRKTSRFIHVHLPSGLSPGRYRIKIDFCNRPFQEMPPSTVSNEFELMGGRK